MARRRDPQPQPHPVDPTRRRHIPNPDEYERGKRDGQADQEPQPEPDGTKPALLLAASAWDLLIHGPAGSPTALARCDTYRWLHTSRTGRAALASVWAGLHLAGCGNLTLLAMWVRRAELIGATS